MSDYENSRVVKIQQEMLRKFCDDRVLTKGIKNHFDKFDESTVSIPWYLKLFTKKVLSIARQQFNAGYSSNKNGASDSVTLKMPENYEGNL